MTTRIQPSDFPSSLPNVMTKMGYNNVLTDSPTEWYDQASFEMMFSNSTYCAVPSNGRSRELYNVAGVFVPPRKEETMLKLKEGEPINIPMDDAWLWVPLTEEHVKVPDDLTFTIAFSRAYWVVGDVRGSFVCGCNDC